MLLTVISARHNVIYFIFHSLITRFNLSFFKSYYLVVYVKHFELPLCMKYINKLVLPKSKIYKILHASQ